MWQHIPLFQQKHHVGSTLVVPQIVPGDRPAEGTGRRNQTWPWVLKIFLYFFKYITRKSYQKNFTPGQWAAFCGYRDPQTPHYPGNPGIRLSFHSHWYQSPLQAWSLVTCVLSSFAINLSAFQRMQVSALPRISCTVFCSVVNTGNFKKEKPKSPSQWKVVNHPEMSWILSQFS